MPWGVWTQQLADLELKIPMASDTGQTISGDIRKQSIKGRRPASSIGRRCTESHCRRLLLELEDAPGELGEKEIVMARKEDKQMWWKNVIVGDPEINTQKVQPENSKLGIRWRDAHDRRR